MAAVALALSGHSCPKHQRRASLPSPVSAAAKLARRNVQRTVPCGSFSARLGLNDVRRHSKIPLPSQPRPLTDLPRRRASVGTRKIDETFAQAASVEIPLPDGGCIPALLYCPPDDGEVVGMVIVAPGSNGGMGPGIEESKSGLPLDGCGDKAAYGSLYRRLGLELSRGGPFDWHGQLADCTKFDGSTRTSRCEQREISSLCGAVAVLHLTWRQCQGGKRWPGPRLRRVDSLQSAADDFRFAAAYMRKLFFNPRRGTIPPLVLVGMSFGGPAAWAAAAQLQREGIPPAGLVALASSGRGGTGFEREELDTLSCVNECAAANIPVLFLHGTSDKNVSLNVASYFYQAYCQSSCSKPAAASFVVLPGAVHMFSNARDHAFDVLKSWLCICFSYALPFASCKWSHSVVPRSLCDGAVVLRRFCTEVFDVPQVTREDLLPASVKGYSEKGIRLPHWEHRCAEFPSSDDNSDGDVLIKSKRETTL